MTRTLDTQYNIDRITKDSATILKNGGIVMAPFDTVYGFICDPKNEAALQKIYDLKKRPGKKIVGLAVFDINSLELIADINNSSREYLKSKTPGRYTFILTAKASASISDFCMQNGAVGVRIPDSELILNIAKAFGGIIAQTSANVSGQPNCYSIDEIKAQFVKDELKEVDLIIDGGELPNLGASQLVDLTGQLPKEIERK